MIRTSALWAVLAFYLCCAACAATVPQPHGGHNKQSGHAEQEDANQGHGIAPGTGADSAARSLAARIVAAREGVAAVQGLHADIRLISFGPQGRLRGRAEVWLSRPDKLRYTLIGPHGGPLLLVACDGQTLWGLDLAATRFVQAPATAAAFDAWLSPLNLHLEAAGWVRLLFGELDVPSTATYSQQQPRQGFALSWASTAGQTVRGVFAKDAGRIRLKEARLCRDAQTLSEVFVVSRTAAGIPDSLRLRHFGPAPGAVVNTELLLHAIQLDPPAAPNTFVLSAPVGMTIEKLIP